MKLILSRKGFDSGTGGVANPILPAGELVMLPIPESASESESGITYDSITGPGGEPLGKIVGDLARGRVHPGSAAHLDPDLRAASIPRLPGWRPLFGQSRASESHLQSQGVCPGDLFLFYGWFREVELYEGRYRYVKTAPDLHLIFGWLQIERRFSLDDPVERATVPTWAEYHPHCRRPPRGRHDSLYLSAEQLAWPGVSAGLPGGGMLPRYHDALRLTAPDATRSTWQLPSWFHPQGRPSAITYVGSPGRWERREDHAIVHTAGRGQEFVLDCDHYPEAPFWAASILSLARAGSE